VSSGWRLHVEHEVTPNDDGTWTASFENVITSPTGERAEPKVYAASFLTEAEARRGVAKMLAVLVDTADGAEIVIDMATEEGRHR
jgi:hypothetical protein